MSQYYKLSVLRRTKQGAAWEYFYFKIDGNKSKILLHTPDNIEGTVSNSRLERITEEEKDKAIFRSNIDWGHG